MADKKYLDYAGLKRVLKRMLPGARKIWHGTIDEWDALSAAEKDKYDQAEIVINAVNKIELNNKHPIKDHMVNAKWGEIGWTYETANEAINIPNRTWLNDKRVIFNNLPEGRYLIIGRVGFSNIGTAINNVGIVTCSQQSIQADTLLLSLGASSVAIPTGDWLSQEAVIAIMDNKKLQNVNLGINVYRAGGVGGTGSLPVYVMLHALKIA